MGLAALYENSKPALAMVSVQLGFTGMNIISKVALNRGMSHFTLVFYRHVVATLVTAPLAYIFERKNRPKLTLWIFCEIFLSGLLGATLNQNFYYAGLSYTTTTFACAISNILPAVTFLMAVPLRIERVGIRSLAGQAKVFGTVVCMGGVMVMTFYKGITLQMWSSPFHLSSSAGNANASQSKDWTKGSLLVVSSCISWSAWFILQAKIGKTYSAQYSSTSLMCFLVTIQSGVLTLIFERGNLSVWALGMDVRLLASIYSGVVATAMAFCIMSWCIARKGPLFVTMFNPLLLIFVAVMSSLILDEKLHMGSVIGSILIVIGLYAVLWGKGKEMATIVKVPKRDLAERSSAHDLSIHSTSEHSNSKEAIIIQHENRDVNPVRELKDEAAALKIQQLTPGDENPDCSMVQIDSVEEIVAIEEENSNSTGMCAES